jgi:uncharacterized membrane protein YfcA
VNSSILFALFGLILILTVTPSIRKRSEELPVGVVNDNWAHKLKLGSTYHDARMKAEITYNVKRTPLGFSIMYFAGLASGLLGIGGGTFKVLAMEGAMRLPMKVSTTTSNFMIGVTAAASAGIYLVRGDVNPFIAAPVMLGILGGAVVGSRLLVRSTNVAIRRIFIVVLIFVASDMLLKAAGILP